MTQIILVLITGLSVGLIIGYFVRKKYFRAKVKINASLIKAEYGPIFTLDGDCDAVITADRLETNSIKNK